jgi:hypothetical protein
MAGFLYYVPTSIKAVKSGGLGLTDPDEIAELGLGHAFETPPVAAGVRGGPDGGNGTLLGQSASFCGQRIGYYPDKQTWRKIPKSEVWLGWYTENLPRPDALRRSEVVPGERVRLGDGNLWLIPLSRSVSDDSEDYSVCSAIPASRMLDDNGNWVRGAPEPRYARLWETANRVWDAIIDRVVESTGESSTIEIGEESDACVDALQANYRVGPAEISALGLLTDQSASAIIKAMVGVPKLLDRLKKKRAESGVSMSDGELGSTQSTVLP